MDESPWNVRVPIRLCISFYRTVNRIRYATCYHDQPYCCENYQLDSNLCIGKVIANS